MRSRRAFTLIELISVIIVLAVLAGVALPRFYDYGDQAEDAADDASLAGIRTAMSMAYVEHRMIEAPPSEWIDDVDTLEAAMSTGRLPEGIVRLSPATIRDRHCRNYVILAETATMPARLQYISTCGGS